MSAVPQKFDSTALRKVLGAFATGVTVITTVDTDGSLCGITANSFSSVSLEPPLVLWSQALSAPSYPSFRDASHFGISILAEDQVEISNRFAKSGRNKFDGIPIRFGKGGVPLIEGAVAYIECVKETSYPGGDHAMFLARVERIEERKRSPLVFASGKYMVAAHHDLRRSSAALGVSSLSHLNGVRLASTAAQDLASSLNHAIGVGVWGNRGPTIIRWDESRMPVSINLRVGFVVPVFGSATGLALAAFLPPEITAKAIARELAVANPDGGRQNLEAAQGLLAGVKKAGHAELIAGDEFTELYGTQVGAISVPVIDRNGTAVLVLTALGHASQAQHVWRDRVADALKEAAATISEKLGRTQEAAGK